MANNNEKEILENMETSSENEEMTEKKDEKKDEKKEKKKNAEKLLEEALKEKAELNDTYLRMLAEYDNFRKRVQKEKETLYSDATADTIAKLLPVLDNLDRASCIEVADTEAKAVLDGVEKVRSQAKEIFEKMGVTEIEALGEKFNPELHNAVMHEEDPEKEESIITEVFMKGYKLHDKVIRYSVVKVVN